MNIAFCISSLKYGGAEKQAVLDANLMSDHHTVFLICFQKGPLEKLLSENVNLICVRKDNYLFTAARLGKILKSRKILYVHSSLFAAMVTTSIASIFLRHITVFWHFHSHEFSLPLLNIWLYRLLGRIPTVRKILFVNSELRSSLSDRFGFPEKKTDILYNVTSLESSSESRKNDNLCTIGYVGRLVGLKRVHLLIECADLLLKLGINGFQILIVGDGPERRNLEKTVGQLGLEKFVEFAGFQVETGTYYKRMEVFALASEEECLSMAAIDAGAMGIPVVAFSVGGNSEIIDDGRTGFIVNTKEEFYEKIHTLVSDKSMRIRMGRDAMEHCSEKFGKHKHIEKLNALYEKSIT